MNSYIPQSKPQEKFSSMIKDRIYEIRVKGVLDTKWSALFGPLALVHLQEETLLTGPIQDDCELFGYLLKIRDMGLKLVSVNRAPIPKFSIPFPELTTERLLLREFDLSDIENVYKILSLKKANRWLETEAFQSIEQAATRLKYRMELFNQGLGFRWAITLAQDPAQVIGSCGYFSMRQGTHTVETGFELHPKYWNKGIMSEALQAMIHFAFHSNNPMPIHRIEALVAPRNTASIHILEKLNFEREGLRREFIYRNDRYQDVYLYALVKNTFYNLEE
jgi:[ribosomal protein S5]-alanine N-acetyltransferase